MIIFNQASKPIGLIAGLLGKSVDTAWWKIWLEDGLVIFLIVPKPKILMHHSIATIKYIIQSHNIIAIRTFALITL